MSPFKGIKKAIDIIKEAMSTNSFRSNIEKIDLPFDAPFDSVPVDFVKTLNESPTLADVQKTIYAVMGITSAKERGEEVSPEYLMKAHITTQTIWDTVYSDPSAAFAWEGGAPAGTNTKDFRGSFLVGEGVAIVETKGLAVLSNMVEKPGYSVAFNQLILEQAKDIVPALMEELLLWAGIRNEAIEAGIQEDPAVLDNVNNFAHRTINSIGFNNETFAIRYEGTTLNLNINESSSDNPNLIVYKFENGPGVTIAIVTFDCLWYDPTLMGM